MFSVRVIFLFLFLLSTYSVTGANNKTKIAIFTFHDSQLDKITDLGIKNGLSIVPTKEFKKKEKYLNLEIRQIMSKEAMVWAGRKLNANIVASVWFKYGSRGSDTICIREAEKGYLLEYRDIPKKENGESDFHALISALHRSRIRYNLYKMDKATKVTYISDMSQIIVLPPLPFLSKHDYQAQQKLFEVDGNIIIDDYVVGRRFAGGRICHSLESYKVMNTKVTGTEQYHVLNTYKRLGNRGLNLTIDFSIKDANGRELTKGEGIPFSMKIFQSAAKKLVDAYVSAVHPKSSASTIIARNQDIFDQINMTPKKLMIAKRIALEKEIRKRLVADGKKEINNDNKLVESKKITDSPVVDDKFCMIAVLSQNLDWLVPMIKLGKGDGLFLIGHDEVVKESKRLRLYRPMYLRKKNAMKIGQELRADLVAEVTYRYYSYRDSDLIRIWDGYRGNLLFEKNVEHNNNDQPDNKAFVETLKRARVKFYKYLQNTTTQVTVISDVSKLKDSKLTEKALRISSHLNEKIFSIDDNVIITNVLICNGLFLKNIDMGGFRLEDDTTAKYKIRNVYESSSTYSNDLILKTIIEDSKGNSLKEAKYTIKGIEGREDFLGDIAGPLGRIAGNYYLFAGGPDKSHKALHADRKARCLVAIIGLSEKARITADMVMASGGTRGIEFVERDKIKKILEEHKLSRSGLISVDSVIRTGRLLKSDMIVLIDNKSGSNNVIVFDVNSGIRLEDKVLVGRTFDKSIADTLQVLSSSINKYRSLKLNSAKFISFLPANIISRDKVTADSIKKIETTLKRNLLKQNRFLLLERDMVDMLIQEQLITGDMLGQLESCSYAIKLETKIIDSGKRKMLLTAYIKDTDEVVRNEFKRTYLVGEEKNAIAEISSELMKIVLSSNVINTPPREYSRASAKNRRDEALVFLTESKRALKEHNYSKSLIALKNTYILDPALKEEISKIILGNVEEINSSVKKYLHREEREDAGKKIQTELSLLDFYNKVNGGFPDNPYIREVNEYLPEDASNQVRSYLHRYFEQKYNKIKSKYDYSQQIPGSYKYYSKYYRFLRELRELWVGNEYWLTYIEPELRKYIKEISALSPGQRKKIVIDRYFYIPDGHYEKSDGFFDLDLYNSSIDILQLMYNSGVFAWKLDAKEALSKIKDLNDIFYTEKYSKNHSNISQNDILYSYKNNYWDGYQDLGSKDMLEFLKYCLLISKDLSDRDKSSLEGFTGSHLEPEYKNGKLQKEAFILLLKLKLEEASQSYLRKLKDSYLVKTNGRYVKISTPIIPQLTELKKIVLQHGDMKTAEFIDKRVYELTERQNALKNNMSRPNLHTFIKSHKRAYKSIENNTKKIFHYGKYNPLGVKVENDFIYSIICNGNYFALAKTSINCDIGNLGEKICVKPQAGLDNIDRLNGLCVTPEYLVYISTYYGGGIIFPKDGSKPEFSEFKPLIGKQLSKSWYLDGKVYFFLSSKYNGVKAPFKIIAFNLKSRGFEVVFSADQESDNPFKTGLEDITLWQNILFKRSTGDVYVRLRGRYSSSSGYSWKYNLAAKKWHKLSTDKERYIFSDGGICTRMSGNNLTISDYGKNREWLNNFTRHNDLSGLVCKPEFSALSFSMKRDISKQKISMWGLQIGPTYLWNNYNVYFLDARVYLACSYIHNIFEYKGELYCLYSEPSGNYNWTTYVGKFKNCEEMKKLRNKVNSITISCEKIPHGR